jgi:3-oxoacyl-[acyl-carrier protein] reductase
MQVELKGKVALVTGGARDIGRATSLQLAKSGASVIVNYHASADKARAVCDEIRAAGGRAVAVQADVTRLEDIRRLVQEASAAFGRIDILVNNAGGLLARKALGEMDMAFWDEVMSLNLRSVAFVTQAALPYMVDGGAIVNLSSLAKRVP